MNLDEWMALAPGDLLQWFGRPDSPAFRLLEPIHREPRESWMTWPEAWTWEPLCPVLRGQEGTPKTISCDFRDFWMFLKREV